MSLGSTSDHFCDCEFETSITLSAGLMEIHRPMCNQTKSSLTVGFANGRNCMDCATSVSYTHLDVYKRQTVGRVARKAVVHFIISYNFVNDILCCAV